MPQPWPAVSPDQTNDIELLLRGRGAEMPDLGFARDAAVGDILEPHPIKDILPGRQTFKQHL